MNVEWSRLGSKLIFSCLDQEPSVNHNNTMVLVWSASPCWLSFHHEADRNGYMKNMNNEKHCWVVSVYVYKLFRRFELSLTFSEEGCLHPKVPSTGRTVKTVSRTLVELDGRLEFTKETFCHVTTSGDGRHVDLTPTPTDATGYPNTNLTPLHTLTPLDTPTPP